MRRRGGPVVRERKIYIYIVREREGGWYWGGREKEIKREIIYYQK